MSCNWFYTLIFACVIIRNSQAHSHSDEDHSHYHEEINESPSFKYSREANVKAHSQKDTHNHGPPKVLSTDDIWLYAMGSTLLISATPVFILFLVPLDNTEQKQPLLKILLAFASGGLLGDAFLHLIPHAAMSVDQHHGHSRTDSHEHVHDMSVGLGVLSGILVFLMIEKSVRYIKDGHGHSHMKIQDVNKKTETEVNDKIKNTNTTDVKDIKIAGYLNLAADFSHNFTDGLAIGASYLAGTNVGLITTITILLHEVPHEIGDFAILVQSGVSRKNAMLLQLTTAIGALAGTALSLLAQDGYGIFANNWILPFTAGGFIYIALVSVIPELLEEDKPSLKQTLLQLFAMLGGVYMMVQIAEFE